MPIEADRDLLELELGSGIDDIIGMAGLPTAGLRTAVCDVNSIKKARYTLQIIAPCLFKYLQESYQESDLTDFTRMGRSAEGF